MQVSWGVVAQHTACDLLLCPGRLQDTACTDSLFPSLCAIQETAASLGHIRDLK